MSDRLRLSVFTTAIGVPLIGLVVVAGRLEANAAQTEFYEHRYQEEANAYRLAAKAGDWAEACKEADLASKAALKLHRRDYTQWVETRDKACR